MNPRYWVRVWLPGDGEWRLLANGGAVVEADARLATKFTAETAAQEVVWQQAANPGCKAERVLVTARKRPAAPATKTEATKPRKKATRVQRKG